MDDPRESLVNLYRTCRERQLSSSVKPGEEISSLIIGFKDKILVKVLLHEKNEQVVGIVNGEHIDWTLEQLTDYLQTQGKPEKYVCHK